MKGYEKMTLEELEEERVIEHRCMKNLRYADEMYHMETKIDLLAIIDMHIKIKKDEISKNAPNSG